MGKGERVNVRHNATTASSQKIVASSHGRVCSNGTITRSLTLHRKLGKSGQSMNVNEARARTNKPWLAQNHNSKFARYRRAALQLLGPWNVAKCPPYRQGQALEQDQQGSRRGRQTGPQAAALGSACPTFFRLTFVPTHQKPTRAHTPPIPILPNLTPS